MPQQLLACAGKVSDAERLACYDTAMAALSADARRLSEAREVEAKAAREAAAASAAAAAAAAEAERKAAFGKPAASADEVQEIEAAISEILRTSTGGAVFILDNGQMWRQVDGYNLPNARVGTMVTVKRGALGSFRLVPKGTSRSAQVIRMR